MKVLEEQTKQLSNKRLEGKVALVTGGSRGIGTAIAKRLAEEGATVALTYSKNKNSAEQVLSEINKDETKAYAYKADVASDKEVNQLIDQIKRDHGKLDILINNAGVWEGGPLQDVDVEQFDRIFDVNVRGVIATTKAALPLLQDNGRIINISSVNAQRGQFGQANYSAAKAGMHGFTKTLAMEVASKGITVNTISPGYIETPMLSSLKEDVLKSIISNIPVGRLGHPKEIADAVAFLVSSDSGFITGANLDINGGQYM